MAPLLAGVLAGGCSPAMDKASPPVERPSPTSVAMRLDTPERLLGDWHESLDRRLRNLAQQDMGHFKELLGGEPTSAVGTAYIPVKEKYSAERGLYRPGDQRVILLSGVSGTIDDPEALLGRFFADMTVTSVPPGPLGGTARCTVGELGKARLPLCAWADSHTLGMVVFMGFRSKDNPFELFEQIRSQTEHTA